MNWLDVLTDFFVTESRKMIFSCLTNSFLTKFFWLTGNYFYMIWIQQIITSLSNKMDSVKKEIPHFWGLFHQQVLTENDLFYTNQVYLLIKMVLVRKKLLTFKVYLIHNYWPTDWLWLALCKLYLPISQNGFSQKIWSLLRYFWLTIIDQLTDFDLLYTNSVYQLVKMDSVKKIDHF